MSKVQEFIKQLQETGFRYERKTGYINIINGNGEIIAVVSTNTMYQFNTYKHYFNKLSILRQEQLFKLFVEFTSQEGDESYD